MSYGTLKVLVAVLSGIIAALVTGILAVAGGVSLPAAVISGGGALVVVAPLVLLLARELRPAAYWEQLSHTTIPLIIGRPPPLYRGWRSLS